MMTSKPRLRLAPMSVTTRLPTAGGVALALSVCLSAQSPVPQGLSPSSAQASPPRDASTQRALVNGVAVELSMQHLDGAPADRVREGDDVRVRFAISDASGTPLPDVRPAAWMDRRPTTGPPDPSCKAKVQELLSGSLFRRAELDLNVYYVLALNGDATITVVDPLFGFGQTRLLALVPLASPGEDWVLTEDHERLFVSMPEANQVAVIDTSSWQATANLDVGPRPMRLALQPDQQYLWVSYDGASESSEAGGVAVVATSAATVAARIATGRGPHEIAITPDSRFAVITNGGSGTASLVDIRRLEKVADVPTGAGPASVAISPLSGLAYVTNAEDGTIVALDLDRRAIAARMTAEPGLGQIRFARGGRYGFAVNPTRDEVSVIDASANRIIQTGQLDDGPDQLAFTDDLVYVRHRGSEIVRMIPLDDIGTDGGPLQVADFPGGEAPFGRGSRPSLAAGMVEAPGGGAMLIANPADRAIYFYKEGMAAPMGHFQNYSREPRAVLVVDRSLRERAPGIYETVVRLRRAGTYDVAFFLDSPQVVHCFPVTVERGPDSAETATAGLEVVGPSDAAPMPAGERTAVRFRLIDTATRQPVAGRPDVRVMAVLAPGLWQDRAPARHADDGTYEVDLTPPKPGIYTLYVECPSCGVSFRQSQPLVLQAVASGEGGQR